MKNVSFCMNGFTHGVGGACSGIVVASLLNIDKPEMFATMVVSSIIASYAVDLDEPQSKAGQKLKPVSWGLKKLLGHRGILHTPFFILLVSGIFFYLHIEVAPTLFASIDYTVYPWMLYICIGNLVGGMSHLLLDTLTPQGIMLLFPFSRSYISFIGWKGKNRDVICTSLIIVATILFLLVKYQLITINLNV